MANTNKTLKNKDQIDIYPITRERNVYDENNINLKEKFKSVVFNDNDIHKFAERLYEESVNEFDANLLNGVSGIIVSDNGEKITMPVVTSGNGGIRVPITLRELCPNMKVGETYTINFYRNYDDTNNFIYLVNSNYLWRPGVSRKITENDLNGEINFYANRFQDGYTSQIFMSEFSIVRGNSALLNWYPYNPNRHITNSEAEFLKEEFGKRENYAENPILEIGAIDGAGVDSSNTTRIRVSNNSKIYIPSGTYYVNFDNLEEFVLYGYANTNSSESGKVYIGSWTKKPQKITIVDGYNYVRFAFKYIDNRTINSVSELVNFIVSKEGKIVWKADNEQIFLKSEYDKSLNELNIENKEYTIDSSSSSYGFTIIQLNEKKKIKAGTYTINLKAKVNSGTGAFNVIRLENGYGNTAVSFDVYDGVSTNYATLNKTITIPNDIEFDYIFFQVRATGVYTFKELMLNKGEPSEYHEWNGKHLTEKDIEPVELWENGNPHVETPSLECPYEHSSEEYPYLIIGFIHSVDQYNVVQYMKIKNVINRNGWLNSSDVTNNTVNVKCRSFKIDSYNKMTFNGSTVNGAVNNYQNVPVIILGSKY